MRPAHALLGLALVAGCYAHRRDDDTLARLAKIEHRLDAQDKAIAEARARADTTELSALAEQLADLQAKLEQLADQLKARPIAQRPQRREPDAQVTYSVPLGKSPVFGSPKAKVTLVMAMDFDCPYCRRAWDTVDELRKRYGSELRVAYKPYVVHPRTAQVPALAACAAHKQGKWRELAELIWHEAFDRRDIDPDAFAAEHIAALARQARLDMKRYEQDIAGACVDEVRDEQASMQKLGVGGTPSFFINGRYLAGARPIEEFAKLIDEEMAKATAAIQGGIKPDQYYDQEIVAKGQPELTAP
jgi:protein-disulfide isomerase